jgi:Family of unknown function (DUF5313)
MSPAERQARMFLRAWPIPDRSERGEEIVGTTLDLLPNSEARLPIGLAVNLVIGGLNARWRMRPPLWRWLHYRQGGRLSPRWQRWMLNDLGTPGWRRRILTFQLATLLPVLLLVWMIMPLLLPAGPRPGPFSLAAPWVGVVVGTLMLPRRKTDKFRARQLKRNLLAHGGSPKQTPWPPPTGAPPVDVLHEA